MLTKSESIKELANALVKFQGSVETIKREEKNPFFKSKYASLKNILDTIQEPLSKEGLSFCQFPSGNGELTTIIMHTSGEWISASTTLALAKVDPQSLGSAITYMRRYALASALGLNIGEDDDGNAASQKDSTKAYYAKTY